MSPISKVNCFFNIILTPITHDAIEQIPLSQFIQNNVLTYSVYA